MEQRRRIGWLWNDSHAHTASFVSVWYLNLKIQPDIIETFGWILCLVLRQVLFLFLMINTMNCLMRRRKSIFSALSEIQHIYCPVRTKSISSLCLWWGRTTFSTRFRQICSQTWNFGCPWYWSTNFHRPLMMYPSSVPPTSIFLTPPSLTALTTVILNSLIRLCHRLHVVYILLYDSAHWRNNRGLLFHLTGPLFLWCSKKVVWGDRRVCVWVIDQFVGFWLDEARRLWSKWSLSKCCVWSSSYIKIKERSIMGDPLDEK